MKWHTWPTEKGWSIPGTIFFFEVPQWQKNQPMEWIEGGGEGNREQRRENRDIHAPNSHSHGPNRTEFLGPHGGSKSWKHWLNLSNYFSRICSCETRNYSGQIQWRLWKKSVIEVDKCSSDFQRKKRNYLMPGMVREKTEKQKGHKITQCAISDTLFCFSSRRS